MLPSNALRHFDWLLFVVVLAMVALGTLFIWSCTHWVPARAGMASQQLRWFAVGLLAMLAVLAVDYVLLEWLAWPAYFAALAGLALVPLIGVTVNNARRWIQLPGFMVQPSEVAKVAVILALARYLMLRPDLRQWRNLAVPLLIVGIPMGMILVQPDLGTSLTLLPVLFGMLLAAGAPRRKLLALIGAGVLAAPLLWFLVMGDAQKGRILSFLWPEADPSGAGWHVRQSLLAISAGGATGMGYSSGSPALLTRGFAGHTDFIFAVIAHEWGFFGALLVLLLLFLLFSRGFAIAAATREPFGRLVAVGILSLMAFQALVNLCMTVRLCPVTGITLPFISYGGSSLVISFAMIGLVLNIGMRRRRN